MFLALAPFAGQALAWLLGTAVVSTAVGGVAGGVVGYNMASKQNKKQIEQLKIQIDSFQKTLTQIKDQLKAVKKAANDPAEFQNAKKVIFNGFLDNLKTYKYTERIPKIPNCKYHILMGQISAGKSSLLKFITGKDLKTGIGQTTEQVTPICQYKKGNLKFRLFDAPGVNEDFSCYNVNTLSLLKAMDEVFIIYKDSLKKSLDLIKIIYAIREKPLILIRTHCDLFTAQDVRTCEQEIKRDYDYMSKQEIPCKIYAFSSKKSMSFKDNKVVAEMIKGGQQQSQVSLY